MASLPADVVTALSCGPPDAIGDCPAFWAFESVRFTARFTDGAGALIEVAGVSFAFLYPDGAEAIVPEGFAVRLGVGVWVCAIVVAKAGVWRAVARCTSPTGSVDVKSFRVKSLPAGTPLPAQTLATDDSGMFALLSDDGALIAA